MMTNKEFLARTSGSPRHIELLTTMANHPYCDGCGSKRAADRMRATAQAVLDRIAQGREGAGA